ncbi:VOC family protein [Corticibacterium sp. UT-5YL-CI-8]|nr:VOC family protein [Tianweitania sp. UT-5YL-CI-8]
MDLPQTNYACGFDITRSSHVVLTVTDIAASRAFYVDTLGFVVTDETSDTLWLRGLEEACHHSIVLQKGEEAGCERIGLRTFTEQDLERVEYRFRSRGLPTNWVEVAGQARTVHTEDAVGTPLEFCASMEVQPRMIMQVAAFRGAAPQRMDHFQIYTPHVARATRFYADMGFRLSEYVVPDDASEGLVMSFLNRKGNPHDIVFAHGDGPRMHHMAFTVPEVAHLMVVADWCAQNDFGTSVEYGPCRHFGPGHARFLYLTDPDGHRIELFPNHYQTMDIEDAPVRWTVEMLNGQSGWGPPPPSSWFDRASTFVGRDVVAAYTPENMNTWAKASAVP